MEIDTSEYQTNRAYYSKLYKSMHTAGIPHSDILMVYGNPYIGVVTKWDTLSYQRQQSILKDYPDTARIADYVVEAKQHLTLDLAMADYTTRDFVNDMVLVTSAIALDFMCPPSSAYTTPVVATSSIRVMARLATKLGTVAAGLGLESQRLYKKADNFFKKKASEIAKPRIQATRGDADKYLSGLKNQGVLGKKGVTKDGHEFYQFVKKCEYKGIKFKKGEYISRDTRHHEWEYFRNPKDHNGAIDPIKGDLYKRADKTKSLKLP